MTKTQTRTRKDIDWTDIKKEGYLSPQDTSVRLEKLAKQLVMFSCELTAIQISIENSFFNIEGS